jgi:hypothetical protein
VKFLNLVVPLSWCGLNHSSWTSTWLNLFKVGDRNGSTSTTKKSLNLMNTVLLPLMPTKFWPS